jgi:hypothetical protein
VNCVWQVVKTPTIYFNSPVYLFEPGLSYESSCLNDSFRNIYNRYMEFNFYYVRIIHLIDRTDVLEISNLVWGGKGILMSLSSSLAAQSQFKAGIVS